MYVHLIKRFLHSVTWMNRIQTKSVISTCTEDGQVWNCQERFSQSEDNHGWIEIQAPPLYSDYDNTFIQILPSVQDTNITYPHIALVDTDKNTTTFVTSGLFVVREILSWDEDEQVIWFMGTGRNSPSSSHLYTVNTDSKDMTCVTCEMVTTRGEECLRNYVEMNSDFTYYVHSCSGPVKWQALTLN